VSLGPRWWRVWPAVKNLEGDEVIEREEIQLEKKAW
jgi:hypothetical protein